MNIRTIAAFLALPLLAACAPQVETTIHLADVEKVLADGAALETPAILRVPQPSEDDCQAGLAALVEKLGAIAPVAGKGQCVSRDGDEFAEIETAVQIVGSDAAIAATGLFALVASRGDGGSVSLSLHVLKPVDDIAGALASGDGVSTDMDPTRFIIRLDNDTAGPLDVAPGEVFVDGQPHLADGAAVTLARKAQIEIRFSDVAAAYAEQGNHYTFASLALSG